MAVDKPTPGQGLRLAELLAAVSLATDLAHDVAAESALRDAVLAVELAHLMGWAGPEVSDAYYLALLYHIGCTGAVAAQSRLGGGDDINVRRWMSEVDYTDRPQMMRIAVAKLAPQWGPSTWAQGIAAFSTTSMPGQPEFGSPFAPLQPGKSSRGGRKSWRRAGRIYPRAATPTSSRDKWVSTPSFTLLKIVGTGDTYTVLAKVAYADQSEFDVVSVLELRHGKIAKATTFFAAPLEAPEWRAGNRPSLATSSPSTPAYAWTYGATSSSTTLTELTTVG